MATEFRQTKVKCPKCGAAGVAPVFDSMDLSESSESTRKMALNGKLFIFQCPECGKKQPLNYPMSCIDDETMSMVTVLDKKNKKEDYKKIYKIYSGLERGAGERYRIVDTCQELSEKLRIFEDGLDDRIIEILKLFICEDVAEDRENLTKVRCVYKKIEDGQMVFSASYGGEQYVVQLPTSSYFPVEEALDDFSDTSYKESYMINQQWADKVAGIMMQDDE